MGGSLLGAASIAFVSTDKVLTIQARRAAVSGTSLTLERVFSEFAAEEFDFELAWAGLCRAKHRFHLFELPPHLRGEAQVSLVVG